MGSRAAEERATLATRFQVLAELCEKLGTTTKRLKKMAMVGRFLRQLPPWEMELAALLLIGHPFPRSDKRVLDVDWSTLWHLLESLLSPPLGKATALFRETGDMGEVVRRLYPSSGRLSQTTLLAEPLTITSVHRTLVAVADVQGQGSRRRKAALLRGLFAQATPLEAKYLVKILIGDPRIGFHEGMLEDTISRTFNVPLALVRRANMLLGNIGAVARIAREEGAEGLKRVRLHPFTPLLPMLAAQAKDVGEALQQHGGECAFEMKLDGARVQIHMQRNGKTCKTRIFSRRLTDVTTSLPDVVALVEQEVTAKSCILEGEVVAVGEDGRPLPFQHLMRRFRRVHDVESMVEEIPVTLYLFDLLLLNGQDLLDAPYTRRRNLLAEVSGGIPLVPRLVTSDQEHAKAFFTRSIQEGHEGLIAKRLDSPYQPGIRGKLWLKIKQAMDTLDLVIIAAEYGHGRRHRWLSDYHLAARDPESGRFIMLGKTFKGLSDAEFEDITRRLMDLRVAEQGNVVFVQPQIVVEVEYDEIQRSPTYSSGLALRFARIKRIRYDKRPEEADTIQRVKELFASQFQRKADTGRVGRTRRRG